MNEIDNSVRIAQRAAGGMRGSFGRLHAAQSELSFVLYTALSGVFAGIAVVLLPVAIDGLLSAIAGAGSLMGFVVILLLAALVIVIVLAVPILVLLLVLLAFPLAFGGACIGALVGIAAVFVSRLRVPIASNSRANMRGLIVGLISVAIAFGFVGLDRGAQLIFTKYVDLVAQPGHLTADHMNLSIAFVSFVLGFISGFQHNVSASD